MKAVMFQSRLPVLLIAVMTMASGLVPLGAAPSAATITPVSSWSVMGEDEAYVYRMDDAGATCTPATSDEVRQMQDRDGVPVHAISSGGLSAQVASLNIVLRATAQLDTFPMAKATFLRAAELWNAKIQAQVPITVIIDVDFGPTRFGQTWGSGVLGSTSSQTLGNNQGYGEIRTALISRANGSDEVALSNALPVNTVPTDLGSTSGFFAPSALLRTLGLINPVADPAAEQQQFGPPPSIGFNSNFAFDFDPSNGIDGDKIDFEAVAVHEIGHALGFTSRVGVTESNPSATVAVSVLDLFRFRPGATLITFPTGQRILTSGGDQDFFSGPQNAAALEGESLDGYSLGGPELPLSTGRPDGTGGDRNQASHWKDNTLVGSIIGIMDPAIARGERTQLSSNDVRAYDAFGYQPVVTNVGAPAIASLAGALQSDSLTLSGSASDPQGDITQAEIALLNGSGGVVRQDSPRSVNFGGSTNFTFSLLVTGLNSVPAAVRASLVFIDAQGNRSAQTSVDFSQAEPGGPNVRSVTFTDADGVMIVKGDGLTGTLQLEVNGQIVAPPLRIKVKGGGAKLKIPGARTELNLRTGANRIRMLNNGVRSNSFIMSL